MFTAAELNDKVAVSMLPTLFQGADEFMAPMYPLAVDDVRFVGDPVALIIAESRYLAEDAAELVEVDYEHARADHRLRGRAAGDGNDVHPNRPSNVAMGWARRLSDERSRRVEAAAHVVSRELRQHRYSMVPMECRGVVANYDPFDERLDVHSRARTRTRRGWRSSRVTGVPDNNVRVQIGDVGGGFGLKSFVGREEHRRSCSPRTMLARPIKWIEDRREHLIASAHARQEKVDMTMARRRRRA